MINISVTHLKDFIGQKNLKDNLKVLLHQLIYKTKSWIIYLFMVKVAWGKQHLLN